MVVAINSEKSCVLEGTRVPERGVEKSHICNSFILLNYKKKSNGISNEDKILKFTVKENIVFNGIPFSLTAQHFVKDVVPQKMSTLI